MLPERLIDFLAADLLVAPSSANSRWKTADMLDSAGTGLPSADQEWPAVFQRLFEDIEGDDSGRIGLDRQIGDIEEVLHSRVELGARLKWPPASSTGRLRFE